MRIVGKSYLELSAAKNQELSVKECGLKILIPAQVITPVDASYEITAKGLWGGEFEFPENSTLISGVCYISLSSSSQLNKPVTVQLEHCANITEEKQAQQHLSFVVAKCGPPFKFKCLSGGSFCTGSQYGTIDLKEFSYLAIVLCAAIGFATLGPSGGVLGAAVAGVIGYHYETSKYILISYKHAWDKMVKTMLDESAIVCFVLQNIN